MFRIVIMAWMFVLALLCATSVEFDGVVQGRALATNIVHLQVGRRLMAVGTHTFRPGRVYWRVAVY